ncbi:MAG: hypothetical protein LQ348_005508 [Seirophora lacunosa]|nr:MAG: hypothetical protein LQ348_005508 [Seirophora lacunosa]
MFSSFSAHSNPFRLPRFFATRSTSAVNVDPVEVHDVELLHEKRARTLKHLLKLNHVNHAVLYHDLQRHNHTPHLLGSAYLFGSDSAHLNDIYEDEAKKLEPWRDSPGEVSKHDWRDYLGNPHYQRAYLDFFEDELVLNGYNWQKVVEQYLLSGKAPLINNLISGLGHPLIHLGYAYEFSSREVAMEALSMAASSYDYLHKYLDDPSYTRPPANKTQSPLEILRRVQQDTYFDGLFTEEGFNNVAPLFEKHEAKMLEYWNAWHIVDPTKEFEASQKAAVALLVASRKPGGKPYDFFIVHILTTSHTVRILLPLLPAKFHVPLVRQWWLLTLAVYIAQLRPEMDLSSVSDYNREGKDWTWVQKEAAARSKHTLDAHFVKGLRAMQTAAETWGPAGDFWLNAAVRFAQEFDGWGGFGTAMM